MRDGNWTDGMGNGNWGWIPMMIMMVAFWGGLIWIGVTLLKGNHSPQLHTPGAPPTTAPSKPTAQEILGERLARGEIEPEDYRLRVEALRTSPLDHGENAGGFAAKSSAFSPDVHSAHMRHPDSTSQHQGAQP